MVIEDEHGMRLRGLCRYLGITTNNEAEYQALIEGLKAAAEWKPERLEVFLDSKLVAEQVKGAYRVKKPELQKLQAQVLELLTEFSEVHIGHVERERNKGADALANRAIDDKVKKPKPAG